MRKEKIMDIVTFILIVVWSITACMVDSEGYIPLIVNIVVSGLIGFMYVLRSTE